MKKMDFTSLLAFFGVPLTVYPRREQNGRYEGTEWVGETDETDRVEVSEPFVPPALATKFQHQEGGRLEKYDMIWFSGLVVPLKSKVKHKAADGTWVEYTVEDSTPYTDYSNVTQYGCKAVRNSARSI